MKPPGRGVILEARDEGIAAPADALPADLPRPMRSGPMRLADAAWSGRRCLRTATPNCRSNLTRDRHGRFLQ